VNASYRLGLLIVAAAVALAAGVAPFVPWRPSGGAAEALDDAPGSLGAFRLAERSGRVVTDADLAGRVWIAAFVFTRCPSSCPRISAVMKGLQGKLAGTGVRLVSLSVDPDHDTPAVLADYARRFGADPDRWWFLTGPKPDVYRLILDRFQVPVAPAGPEERAAGAEAVSHSARLALVDRGNRVVGYFDASDPEAVSRLLAKARQRDLGWVLRLPAVNATLNGTCAALLLAGWALIRRGRVRAHVVCMAAGLAVSALFLACYLVYHYHVGSVPFRGVGPVRAAYFTVLLSHTTLAVAVVPLVALTLARAIRGRYKEHAGIARVAYPIWLYVSITGVIVYLMLYQMDIPTSPA
jgi:protein SCO1